MSGCRVVGILSAGLCLLGGALTGMVQPQTPPAELLYPETTTLPATGVVVPMEFRGPMPAVDVHVNGKGPYRFAIDTGGQGAARADERLVAELELPVVGDVLASDGAARRARPMNVVRIDALEFGAARFESLRAASRAYEATFGRIDGVLGFNLFAEGLLTLDYPGREVRFEHGALSPPDGQDILEMEAGRSIPTISIEVAGVTVQATIDSGAMGGTLLVPPGVADDLRWIAPPRTVGRGRTVAGEFDIKEGVLDGDVRIGQHRLVNPPVQFSTGSPREYANIGSEILHHFATTYDQKNRRVRFNRDASGPIRLAPAYRVGLMLAPGQDGLRVDSIVAGGAADAAGLRAGDVIRQINGRRVGAYDGRELRQVLGSPAPVLMTVQRDGAEQTVQVTPRRVEPGKGGGATATRPAGPRRRVRRVPPGSAAGGAAAELLRRMDGAFQVAARFRRGPEEPFESIAGSSKWTPDRYGRYVHEVFEMKVDGRSLRGEVFFGASADGQYELVQVDAFNPGMIHVAGSWNAARGRLTMERVRRPAPGGGMPGRPLQWVYRLGDDQSFVKEMYVRDTEGEWFLSSDYHYQPEATPGE